MGLLVSIAVIVIVLIAVHYLVAMLPGEMAVYARVIEIVVFAGAAIYILLALAKFLFDVGPVSLHGG